MAPAPNEITLSTALRRRAELRNELDQVTREVHELARADPAVAAYLAEFRKSRRDIDDVTLRRSAKVVVVALCLLFAAGMAISVGAGAGSASSLPAVSLKSPLLLHLERCGVGVAIIGAIVLFLVRGWGGDFPRKVSTTGAEWADEETAAQLVTADSETKGALEEVRTMVSAHSVAIRELRHRLGSGGGTDRPKHE